MTKVHHRDVNKIPMTEKVCQLYEEEQLGKTREGRKAVPTNKMPHLAWDIAETQLIQENQGNNNPHMTLPLQTLITIIIMLITSLEHITAYMKKIPKFAKKMAQVVKSTITKASRNELLQNIKDSYKTTMLVITIRRIVPIAADKYTQLIEICKTIQACENSMTSTTNHTSCTHPRPTITAATSMTSCSTVSVNLTQRLSTETKTPEHKALNNALVLKNEVLSITWKLSINHGPFTYITRKYVRIARPFISGIKTGKSTHQKDTWNIELGI